MYSNFDKFYSLNVIWSLDIVHFFSQVYKNKQPSATKNKKKLLPYKKANPSITACVCKIKILYDVLSLFTRNMPILVLQFDLFRCKEYEVIYKTI